jgi:hypothetical protein
MTCSSWKSNPGLHRGEHSRKEPFEQLVISDSEHLHISLRQIHEMMTRFLVVDEYLNNNAEEDVPRGVERAVPSLLTDYTVESIYIDWRWPLSCVCSMMVVFPAQLAEGGGARPLP